MLARRAPDRRRTRRQRRRQRRRRRRRRRRGGSQGSAEVAIPERLRRAPLFRLPLAGPDPQSDSGQAAGQMPPLPTPPPAVAASDGEAGAATPLPPWPVSHGRAPGRAGCGLREAGGGERFPSPPITDLQPAPGAEALPAPQGCEPSADPSCVRFAHVAPALQARLALGPWTVTAPADTGCRRRGSRPTKARLGVGPEDRPLPGRPPPAASGKPKATGRLGHSLLCSSTREDSEEP